jgi:hypothetical protein
MNRRDLIQRVVLGGAVLVLAPSVLSSCTKDSTTDPGGGEPKPSKIDLDLTKPENSALLNDTGHNCYQYRKQQIFCTFQDMHSSGMHSCL